MAEHSRGIAFLIMDGVLPGNEGRDYVLRRIIRRAVQQGVSIGLDEPFLPRLSLTASSSSWARPTRRCSPAATRSAEIVGEEETRFTHTLAQGMGILDEALRRAPRLRRGASLRPSPLSSMTPTVSRSTSPGRSCRTAA